MSDTRPGTRGVRYTRPEAGYFERRGLRRHAGVWSLWALGVGAVISGHFSGWNLGLATAGWGGMLLATGLIALMYLGLTFSIAEMSPALPHTGGAYSFARTALGPWGGFLTGLAENVEYVLVPATIAFFIGSYMTGIFETPVAAQPLWWLGSYVLFVGLNIAGVELSFRITLVVTLLALACLVMFWVSALPTVDVARWALDVGENGTHLDNGHGPFLPNGWRGVLTALPFAVWLFLAVEQLPLAAEESHAPQRDMPTGILAAMFTLLVSAFMILWLNPSVAGVGAYALATSGEPLLDALRAIYGDGTAKLLAGVAVVGLIASFHTIIYAKGRQIYSLSRAGYFPTWLSVTHGRHKTPHVAMLVGTLVALTVMLVLWFGLGAEAGGVAIGGTLLNMGVFAAMFSYIMQALSFVYLRRRFPDLHRPWRSPLGLAGPALTMAIGLTTLWFQLADPTYRQGVLGVALWFALGVGYFALVGRRRLILSPEEEFAMQQKHTGRPAS
ncbi:MAG: amino acid permease [Pseudomonadales bacterium]|nr:amino acid permease [Pseudomonadales bacterium]MCP5182597.1 amino acid permease [Pseudomonadales bacterium]